MQFYRISSIFVRIFLCINDMKRVILVACLLCTISVCHADEGMWLLQLMQQQHVIDRMKAQGFNLDALDVYNPNAPSLKDVVGLFGGGCTAEIVSSEGLLLTNHHCGYGFIQRFSTVEHDYLTNGFWAGTREEELKCPGLTFQMVDKIIDVTSVVEDSIRSGKTPEEKTFAQPFLSRLAKEQMQAHGITPTPEKETVAGRPVVSGRALPYYAGNKYYLLVYKTYTDVRMVAAPPSSVGKFGGETDNWMWPRHTCDFSMFRIYGEDGKPLQTDKHLAISLKGVEEGDYAMIMGFPGSTYRYLTASEVVNRMKAQNDPRIKVREARQAVLKEEMRKSDAIRIQYASKYASSSNYWKNSIGMNKAIIDNKVIETKKEQEARFADFARQHNNQAYAQVVGQIDEQMKQLYQPTFNSMVAREFISGIEFFREGMSLMSMKNDKTDYQKVFERIHNKDYDHNVDRKVAKQLLPLFRELMEGQEMPACFSLIDTKFKGDTDAFVDYVYDKSVFANAKNFAKSKKKLSEKVLEKDPLGVVGASLRDFYRKVAADYEAKAKGLDLLHKTYVRGLCDMYAPTPKAPDANLTLRMTYGNVKSYDPRDGVHYEYYTTLRGVMEKEDATNPEFVVPAKLKELYEKKDFGRYATKNGELPACFLTTNDITGGNSGSPVINGDGELIGIAFDGNWESLSGDINFDNGLQRCIAVDIRYVLFVLDKLGNCGYLVNEMTISE